MSIKITIEKVTEQRWTSKDNVVAKETPTEYLKYGDPVMAKEYAVMEVTKSATSRVTLLEQTIEQDADFDLAAVIVAINKLGAA